MALKKTDPSYGKMVKALGIMELCMHVSKFKLCITVFCFALERIRNLVRL